MSEMFKNYPQPEDYIPDNHPRCWKEPKLEIMCGETAHHTFDIPFNVEETCTNVEVIYKLGLTDVIVRGKEFLDITIMENNTSVIVCNLSNEDTLLFKNNLLSKKVQIKFYLKDGSISFSNIYDITTIDAIDDGTGPIPPGTLGGIGYTEE